MILSNSALCCGDEVLLAEVGGELLGLRLAVAARAVQFRFGLRQLGALLAVVKRDLHAERDLVIGAILRRVGALPHEPAR